MQWLWCWLGWHKLEAEVETTASYRAYFVVCKSCGARWLVEFENEP